MSILVIIGLCFFLLACIYVGLHLFAHFCAPKMIFPAPESSYEDLDGLFRISCSSVEDGLAAIYLESDNPKAVLLYCHGNAEDLGSLYLIFQQYHAMGYSVLAYDYAGYGLTGGQSSEENCQQAVLSVYDYLVQEKQVEPSRIYGYGRSLGGGSAFYLASKRELGGLIVEGTFTSTYRVMTRYKLLHKDCFDNLALLPEIHCPLLVIHGKLDWTVPFWHGEKLFDRYRGRKRSCLWLDDAGHNDIIEVGGDHYWDALKEFTE